MKALVVTSAEHFDREDPIPGLSQKLGATEFTAVSVAEFREQFAGDTRLRRYRFASFGVDNEADDALEATLAAIGVSVSGRVGDDPRHRQHLSVDHPPSVAGRRAKLRALALSGRRARNRARRGVPLSLSEAEFVAPQREGRVISVFHTSGGVGASTVAINLAWERALEARSIARSRCSISISSSGSRPARSISSNARRWTISSPTRC